MWKIANGSSTYYINDPTGKTETVQQGIYSSTYTYNIWGADNIGQADRRSTAVYRYYYLKDHLGSIRMTVDASANTIGYNDYYPFGMTMAGRSYISGNMDGRYQFTAKERDAAETGYDYFGARYYDSWHGGWLSIDPLTRLHPGYSPYVYVYDNPIHLIDPDGQDSTQRAAAVAEANKYVEKNPHPSPSQYKFRAKGGPGQPTDCSGLTSNCVVTTGAADPNHGSKPTGVANTIDNTSGVDTKDAQPGNLVVYSIQNPNDHIGIITDVTQKDGNINWTVVQSDVHSGPEKVNYSPGDKGYWGSSVSSVRVWDTPDPILNWISSAPTTQFQTVVSDQTYVGY